MQDPLLLEENARRAGTARRSIAELLQERARGRDVARGGVVGERRVDAGERLTGLDGSEQACEGEGGPQFQGPGAALARFLESPADLGLRLLGLAERKEGLAAQPRDLDLA